MDPDELQDRADDPRLGHPYFEGGVDDMLAAWARHLFEPEIPGPDVRPADDGFARRTQLLGAAPEMGELIVPTLNLPQHLPTWCSELLVCFVDILINDDVARIWDAGGPAAVTHHLARYDLSPDELRSAAVDDMFFLGMVAMEVLARVKDAGDRIRAIAVRHADGSGPLSE